MESGGWCPKRLSAARRIAPRTGERAVECGYQECGKSPAAIFSQPSMRISNTLRNCCLRVLESVWAADLVIATRLGATGSFGEMPWLRRLLSRGARRKPGQLPCTADIQIRVSDPLSGYYFVPTRSHGLAGIELRLTGFKTLLEVLARGRVKTIEECAYAMQARRRGTSTVRWRHLVEYL